MRSKNLLFSTDSLEHLWSIARALPLTANGTSTDLQKDRSLRIGSLSTALSNKTRGNSLLAVRQHPPAFLMERNGRKVQRYLGADLMAFHLPLVPSSWVSTPTSYGYLFPHVRLN